MATTIQPGSKITHYRVVGPLGAGGMGEVYLAEDLTLERKVALKILPPGLVKNEERLRRFVLEAKSASSLNHPNIVTIYEIGDGVVEPGGAPAAEEERVHYIAMELVSGATLTEKIHREKADLKTLLGYLAQAADGLAKAHAAGIVHRDVKPGNIMITTDGFAKILDFGLAKLTEQAVASPDATSAPTATRDETGAGVVLGTAGYMSPEQVQGKAVDHRSDVFSFGCVLYEAATRQRPFAAESGVETMHRILRDKPQAVEELNPAAPAEVRRLIRRCLAKAPDQRFQSLRDVSLDLREIVEDYDTLSPSATSASSVASGASGMAAAPPRRRSAAARAGIAAVIAVALIGGVAGIAAFLRGREAPGGAASRTSRVTMSSLVSKETINGSALSPDGQYAAYSTGFFGTAKLVVRQVATGSEIEIFSDPARSIEGVVYAPDGGHIFFRQIDPESNGASILQRIPTLGGDATRVATDVGSLPSFAPGGGSICFTRTLPGVDESRLIAMNLSSGDERVVASFKSPASLQGTAAWSPDGARIAVAVDHWEGGTASRIVLVDAAEGRAAPLGETGWLRVRNLAWLRDGSALLAAAYPLGDFENVPLWLVPLSGSAPERLTDLLTDYAGISLSSDGESLLTVSNQLSVNLWRAPSDGGGDHPPLTDYRGRDSAFAFATLADGSIAFHAHTGGEGPILAVRPDGAGLRRLTPGPMHTSNPLPLPGGGLAFAQVDEGGSWRLAILDPAYTQVRLLGPGTSGVVLGVSPDGRHLLAVTPESPRVLVKVSVDSGAVETIATDLQGDEGPFERDALYSPDGGRIAYRTSRKTERGTVKVLQILTASGGEPGPAVPLPPGARTPRWSPDGASFEFIDQGRLSDNVARIPASGGPVEMLSRFEDGRIVAFQRSLDGRRIAVSRRSGARSGLWVVDERGGAVPVAEISEGITGDVAWVDGGKTLVFHRGILTNSLVLLRGIR